MQQGGDQGSSVRRTVEAGGAAASAGALLRWADAASCRGLPSLPTHQPEWLCRVAIMGTSPWLLLLAVPAQRPSRLSAPSCLCEQAAALCQLK